MLNGTITTRPLKFLFSTIIFFSFFCVFGQFSKKYEFGNYLISSSNFSEVLNYPSIINLAQLSNEQSDSLNFLMGKAHFYDKSFDLAKSNFSSITETSLYGPSQYYSTLSNLYLGNYGIPNSTFINLPNQSLNSLIRKGDFILLNNTDSAKSLVIRKSDFLIQKHFNDLDNVIVSIENHKSKSAFLAGLMSAIIPGSGKFYSGKVGEGMASLLMVGILTASSIEQFNNGGFSNPQFYIMSLPAVFFYVGNIYGSYFSVKVSNIEFNEQIRDEVLFHLHIPFKSIYRQ